ncbi:diacylglycerol kinase [Alteromonas sp. D210916BOD_24]|uniref:diacylglycerol kinase n=1 Tax=Alteromonas sp. D210916BOD_24 TaxID=3157618 RepID=UPI00399C92E5
MRSVNQVETAVHFEPSSKPTGLRRLLLAFKNSYRALTWLIKNETAFRQELVVTVIAIAVLCVWSIPTLEKALLFSSVLFILFAEIINTAIEATIDRIGTEIHPLSGLAKDLGSAGVLLATFISSILWLAVFIGSR